MYFFSSAPPSYKNYPSSAAILIIRISKWLACFYRETWTNNLAVFLVVCDCRSYSYIQYEGENQQITVKRLNKHCSTYNDFLQRGFWGPLQVPVCAVPSCGCQASFELESLWSSILCYGLLQLLLTNPHSCPKIPSLPFPWSPSSSLWESILVHV